MRRGSFMMKAKSNYMQLFAVLFGIMVLLFSIGIVSAQELDNDPNSTFTAFSVVPMTVLAGGSLTWSASATCTGPSSGPNSCSAAGTSVGGAVVNTYEITIEET